MLRFPRNVIENAVYLYSVDRQWVKQYAHTLCMYAYTLWEAKIGYLAVDVFASGSVGLLNPVLCLQVLKLYLPPILLILSSSHIQAARSLSL